jgi:hypothetical protein
MRKLWSLPVRTGRTLSSAMASPVVHEPERRLEESSELGVPVGQPYPCF